MDKERIRNAYINCLNITKSTAKNFYYSFLLLPPKQKFAMFAIYSFCRVADDMADSNLEADKKFYELELFEEKFKSMLNNKKIEDDLFIALRHTFDNFKLDADNFFQLIEGVEIDIVKNRYRNFGELYLYCYKVAVSVALICFDIFIKEEDKPVEFGINLGIALQLTNIIRDIKEDKDNNRIYLPTEDLQRFEYSENDLFDEKINSNFIKLIKFQIARAKEYYNIAEKSMPTKYKKNLYTLLTIKDMYFNLLLSIEKNPELLFYKRFSLNTSYKIYIALKNYFSVILL